MIDWQSTPKIALPTSSPASSPQDSPVGMDAAGLEVVTRYNEQGFPTVVTEPQAAATAAKHYDEKGFLITSGPALVTAPTPTAPLVVAASAGVWTTSKDAPSSVSANSSRLARALAFLFAAASGHLVAAWAN